MIFKSIRKKLKVFSVLSSLILLIPTRTDVRACAYGPDYEELRYMLLNPDLLGQKAWWTFFYTNRFEYLDGNVAADTDETQLATEWKEITKTDASLDDIKACLFGSLPDSLLEVNAFYSDLQKQPDALAYFGVAKECEAVAAYPSPWEDDPETEASRYEVRERLMNKINTLLAGKPGNFRQKYAFQLLKLAYYSDDHGRFHQTFQKYFEKEKQTVLYWWAQNYRSMMFEREEKLDSANFLHAKVYANASAKMLVSKRSFSVANFENVLALAQSKEDSADVWLLAATINPGPALEQIKEVYNLQPTHRHLPLLIMREINKLEDWLGSTQYAESEIISSYGEGEGSRVERDRQYLKEFTTLLDGMDKLAGAYADVYHLWMADLWLMQHNPSTAAVHLGQVRAKDGAIGFQKKVFELVRTAQAEDILSTDTQDKIGEQFKELLDARYQQFESQKILYSVSLYYRYLYANKGRMDLAGLFDNYAQNKFCYYCSGYTFEYSMIAYFEQFASAADLEKLLTRYAAKDKNELEEVLLTPYTTPYYITDLLGTLYLRNGDLKNAQRVFSTIPDDFWFSFGNASENLDTDPFLYNAELLSAPGMATYNKKEIVDRLIALEEEAARDASKAERNYMMLGNAWFNFTQHAWFVLSYGRSYYDDRSNYQAAAVARARTYYDKVLGMTKNTETKARITYMFAVLADEDDKLKYALAFEKFASTEFYQQRNCLTLQDMAY
jgi:hypothetical protein